MKLLLSLINKLYGSKAIQKTIGTRTNVITLPNKQTKQLLNEQLNLGQASDQQVLKLKDDIEKLIPDIPKMNDSEILNLTSNLQKIDNRLNPPQAEIIEMGTKQPVSPSGIEQLAAKRGLPKGVEEGSMMGKLLRSVQKLRDEGVTKPITFDDVIKQQLKAQTGYPSIQREGMVRTAVREIMNKDLKSGKLKIKDPEVKTNLEKYISSGEDPIETFRKYYGEDRLADIDDVAEELLPAQSYTEIQDILKQKKLYDLPVKKKGAGEYDPAIKEGEKITKDIQEGKIKPMNVEPEEFAIGGRVGFSQGKLVGKGITKLLERFAKDKKKSRLLTDDEIEEFAEELGDTETWMSSGTLKEAEEAAKRRKDYEQQMYSEYQVDKQGRKELEQAYKEIDFRMTGEDTKYEANELADMLSEIRYKTEFSELPQKTQIDLYGEAYDYLLERQRDAAQFKGAVDIKSGQNIVTREQEIPIDPMTGKPRKLNANGGRIGFSDGGNEALLEQLYEKFLDLGLSPKEAADAAKKEFEQRARKAGGGIAYLMGL